MSKKLDLEMQTLAKALVNRFQTAGIKENPYSLFAAGITRLGKIEFLDVSNPSTHISSFQLREATEESLLIRVRQKRYSSVGIIESDPTNRGSLVQLRLEHESGNAQVAQIPFRIKRPHFITLGAPIRKPAALRWFQRL